MKLFNNSVLFSLLVVAFLCIMQASAVETEVERLLKNKGKGGCGKIKDANECGDQDECTWCKCGYDYICPNPLRGKHAAGGKCISDNDVCQD